MKIKRIHTLATFVFCLLLVACEQSFKSGMGVNAVKDVQIEAVTVGGKEYHKVTIEQSINPQAPTYVIGLREKSTINKIAWSPESFVIGETSVTSVFHIRPLVPMDTISLRREDFIWSNEPQYFRPIVIDTEEFKQARDNNSG